MLQSEVQTAARAAHLDDLGQAALEALTAGATRDEVMTTLSSIIDYYHGKQDPMPGLLLRDDAEVIYDKRPDGLIDLPTAAREYEIPMPTLNRWIQKGIIETRGRLKAPARGGGYHLLAIGDIKRLKETPPKRGGKR